MAEGASGADIRLDVETSADRPGYRLEAYRAAPAGGRGAGVLVLGGTDPVSALARDAADRLARAGFVALAPNAADASAAANGVAALLDDHAVDGPRVGAVGFARGGALALELAARERRVGAVVDWEGLPVDAESLPALEVEALLLVGAEHDEIGAFSAIAAGRPGLHLHVEPDAGAGYMDARLPDRHVAAAAASSWDRALAFLSAAL